MKKNDDPGSSREMQRRLIELSIASETLIDSFVHALDLREGEVEGHTQRVAQLAVRFAGMFGLSEAQLKDLEHGALLHDIGKMGVPDQILQKPGSLEPPEWDVMRRHPQIAYDLLSPVAYLNAALDVPYCHHERWDGNGYPQGLRGEQIPLAARIFSVVDVWDALTSDRPFRKAWSKADALDYIRSQAGAQFDPGVVRRFMTFADEMADQI